jgi:AcrR family transcriptional regulator
MIPEPRPQPMDLRTRKRVAAMQRIQRVALDLFERHGYESVTVAEIASAADVGERSIYRYFGTKPMLVLHDEIDRHAIDTFAEAIRDHTLLDAVRATLTSIERLLTPDAAQDAVLRLELLHDDRELQAARADYIDQLGAAIGRAIAVHRDVPTDDLSAQVHGRCIVTALGTAIDHWYRHGPRGPLIDDLHRAVDSIATIADI